LYESFLSVHLLFHLWFLESRVVVLIDRFRGRLLAFKLDRFPFRTCISFMPVSVNWAWRFP
jgi:hypothetical protein